MVGASKILTVSYGTFSCTLEGFDDPFSTMRSIAEYFRDLAADDRYFGAEPPTPDAEMLQRIAEKEIQRRVEARVEDNGLVLKQLETDSETPAPAPEMVSAAAATAFAPTYEDEIEVAGEELPQAAEVKEVEADAGTAETVAEKLSRIRAVVDSARDEDAEPVKEEAVAEVVEDLSALEDEEDAGFEDDATEDDIADALSAFDADGYVTSQDDEAEDTTEVAEASDDTADQMTAEGDADADAEETEEVEAVADEDEMSSDDIEEPVAFDDAEEDVADDQVAEDDAEVEAEVEAEPIGRVVKLSGDDYAAGDEVADTDMAQAEASEEVAAEASDEMSMDDDEDDWDFDAPEDEDESEELAALDGVEDEVVVEDDDEDDFAAEEAAEDADDELVATDDAEDEDEDDDDVAAFDDEDFAVEAADEYMEDENDVEEAGDDVAASIRAALGSNDFDEDEDEDDDELTSEADEDFDDLDDEDDDALAAGAIAARERLGSLSEEEEQTSDVDRLLEKTNSQMEESEGSRRRSAIAHLKAAVAATKADRLLKRVTSSEKSEEDEQTQYRDDLAQVVRPRRPDAGEVSSERPQPIEEAASPLMLVSELRVDEDGNTVATSPIRPRRVSHDEAADAAAEAESSSYEDGASFSEFAEKMGAKELPDLLEAAAAYAAFVENRPHFSRPQLMKRVARHDTSGEFTREAGLRSFGQLLRQGKIRKLKRGQFTVADTTRFNPDARIAGE